jgi:3-dehydroquinate synthase
MVIPVQLGARSYSVVVEAGALAKLGDHLRPLGLGSRAALVSDPSIRKLYGEMAAESLRTAGLVVSEIDVPEGEAAKSLAVAERCWEALLAAGLDRSSTVLALGGGGVGDVAGFVAATYMRGMNLVQVPTTVLAQVDASIGGKTAIDHPRAKNLIGAFHQPRLVVVDPSVARTLSEREFRSGLAEVVKHGVVLDRAHFEDVEKNVPAVLARDLGVLERLITDSCRLKVSVIERDPDEKSELRFALNYGHTIGHALEAATGYARWRHGEAVALGIVAEARLARRLGVASDETVTRQERLLSSLGLPTRLPSLDSDAVLTAIGRDKKARNGRIPFVLAPTVGTFRLVYDVPADDVRAALAGLESR